MKKIVYLLFFFGILFFMNSCAEDPVPINKDGEPVEYVSAFIFNRLPEGATDIKVLDPYEGSYDDFWAYFTLHDRKYLIGITIGASSGMALVEVSDY